MKLHRVYTQRCEVIAVSRRIDASDDWNNEVEIVAPLWPRAGIGARYDTLCGACGAARHHATKTICRFSLFWWVVSRLSCALYVRTNNSFFTIKILK